MEGAEEIVATDRIMQRVELSLQIETDVSKLLCQGYCRGTSMQGAGLAAGEMPSARRAIEQHESEGQEKLS